MSFLDTSMQSLLENIKVNKRAIGGGSILCAGVVAICSDQLSELALVPLIAIGRVSSTLVENSTPGSTGLSSINGVEVATSGSQAASSN